AACTREAPPVVQASVAPHASERPYVSRYALPPICTGCVAEGNACQAHSVSPCRWVLGAPEDPIDLIVPCEATCCPDHDAPELCAEFALDATVAAAPLCPQRGADGRVHGRVEWHDADTIGFVLAQAHGLVTSASEHSALTDRKTGAWSMPGVPSGDVVFS